MSTPLLLAILFLLTVWLSALTYFLWRMSAHYTYLTRGVDKKNLQTMLESIVKETGENKKMLVELQKQYDTIEQEGRYHIQKMGLLRFNPFKDTGGDQSFILTLVDAHDTGVIISGLYSRSGTRWYAKKIIKGKSQEHDLSDEEKKALKLAQPISHQ